MKDKPNDKNKLYYSILAVVSIILIIIGVLVFNNQNTEAEEELDIAYTDLIKKIDNKEVENVIRACLIEYDCRTIDLINYDVILLI